MVDIGPTVLLAHAPAKIRMQYEALLPRGVRVVPFKSPYPGLSRAYDALASGLREPDGRLLPCLLRWLSINEGPVVLGWYSAGYALARALARHPQDRAEIVGWVGIDGGNAELDPDGTVDDAGVAWAVELASVAATGGAPFWFGHSDVRGSALI